MKERVAKSFGFLKTTAIGGLVFLLPLVVLGALLGYVFSFVKVIYDFLQDQLGLESPLGLLILFLLAILILLALCFLCGLAARRALARKFTEKLEKQLVMVYPKYAIYKDIVAGNLGGNQLAPSLKPITIQWAEMVRIGYEAGRTSKGLVIVYLPGSPDPWIGSVVLVEPSCVSPLDVDFNETAAICERLGRGSAQLLGGVTLGEAGPEMQDPGPGHI